jgi:hypothetical protein
MYELVEHETGDITMMRNAMMCLSLAVINYLKIFN